MKTVLLFLFITLSLPALSMEVYVPGEIKKTSACCYVIKTSEGKYIKILKPKNKLRDPDPFKFKLTMSYIVDSVSYAYDYWRGKVKFR